MGKLNISPEIRASANGEMCLADWCGCGGTTETTVFCHIRKFGIAGMGQKPPDLFGFYGCHDAHMMFDQRKDQVWSWEGLMFAMMKTQEKLLQKKLIKL